jgi:hypothetical protein
MALFGPQLWLLFIRGVKCSPGPIDDVSSTYIHPNQAKRTWQQLFSILFCAYTT